MNVWLERIVAVKREEVSVARRTHPIESLPATDPVTRRDFHDTLARAGMSAIAEIKRRSPSKGALRPDLDPADLAAIYERHGARAISVLTDREFFGGSLDDLVAAKSATELPVLRKDFTIDPYQIHEAAAGGADAVLLIVRILGRDQLSELHDLAASLGLAVLVEVHDEPELRSAIDIGARIVGINNRNLDTFEVDTETASRLRADLPPDRLVVAESGIGSREQVERLEREAFDAMLVGETLMRAGDVGGALAGLLGRSS
ncbi:MAG: indole-3-glycerol phosphate synthase TrpC [bacterium]|nr:indole-3-glycerol phosphate synthase TrpC [bacterium]